tara:strand:+ start:5173 stop:6084 length:912 start_codon:yes stop_codon:yes gene_type:complete
MSEETPAPDPTPVAPVDNAPTQEAPPTPAPAPSPNINLDATVQVDGVEVTVGQLVDVAKQASGIHEYNQHASVLMQQGASDTDKEAAVRYLMNVEGYQPDQIDEYVTSLKGEQPQEEAPMTTPDPLSNENKQRLESLENNQRRMNADFLRQNLNETLDRVMESNPKIRTLLDKGEEMNPNSDAAERRSSLRSQIERSLMDNVRSRKSRGENFNLSWFSDEATKAADNIYNRISTVIGDPNKIGRAPETASGLDSFFANKKPVEAPQFADGDNMGTMDSKAREYNVDALSRLAEDLSTGDQSKL